MSKTGWCYDCKHGVGIEDAYGKPCIWCEWHEKTIWREDFWNGCDEFCGDLKEALARIIKKREET